MISCVRDAAWRISLSGAYSVRGVPGARGVRVGELDHDAALPRPVALEHLDGAAARDEAAAVVGDRVGVAAAVLLQRRLVSEVARVGDRVGRHQRARARPDGRAREALLVVAVAVVVAAAPVAAVVVVVVVVAAVLAVGPIWPRISPPGDSAVWTFAYVRPQRIALDELARTAAPTPCAGPAARAPDVRGRDRALDRRRGRRRARRLRRRRRRRQERRDAAVDELLADVDVRLVRRSRPRGPRSAARSRSSRAALVDAAP